MKALHLSVIAFTCGFVVMAFEITGSRVMAPFLGTSIFVWTSLISTILGFMSLGYAFGGQQADRYPNAERMMRMIVIAACAICLTDVSRGFVLRWVSELNVNLMLKALAGAVLLFSIPSFFLASVFPFILKLSIKELGETGSVSGKYYAISSVGSIAGTIGTAVLLLPNFHTANIHWILAILLLILVLVFGKNPFGRSRLTLMGFCLLSISYSIYPRTTIDIDTTYHRVWITDGFDRSGRHTRLLTLNGHVNSGIYRDDPVVEQLFPYSSYFRLIEHFKPGFQDVMMLGAGAFSFPKYFQYAYPNARLCVVEIDPELERISSAYFGFQKSENTRIIAADARTALKDDSARYDAIISDVFTSPLDVPFQMTTVECNQIIHSKLNADGVYIVNILGSRIGPHSRFLKSELQTLAQVFPQIHVFAVQLGSYDEWQNFVVVALKTSGKINWETDDHSLEQMLNHRIFIEFEDAMILRDEYAPVEWMLGK